MDPPPVQTQLKRAYHGIKILRIVLFSILTAYSIYAATRNKWFIFIAIMSILSLVVNFFAFSLKISADVVQEERILLIAFLVAYIIIMSVISPDYGSSMKGNSTESQNYGENDKVLNTTQKDEGALSYFVRNQTNETERLWEATENLTHNVLKSDADSTFKLNKNDPEFKYHYFMNLVLICLIVIFQSVLLYLAWKIKEHPAQLLDDAVAAPAAPLIEEEIPLQPIVNANENLELEQDPGEGPSSEPLQPSQNVITHRNPRALEDNDLEPREDLDGANFKSLVEACLPMDGMELRTGSLETKKSSMSLSTTAAASSPEENPLQFRSEVETLPKE